jgi:hypothetical protein
VYAKQPEAQQLFSCLFAAVRPPDRIPLNALHCRNIRRFHHVAEDVAVAGEIAHTAYSSAAVSACNHPQRRPKLLLCCEALRHGSGAQLNKAIPAGQAKTLWPIQGRPNALTKLAARSGRLPLTATAGKSDFLAAFGLREHAGACAETQSVEADEARGVGLASPKTPQGAIRSVRAAPCGCVSETGSKLNDQCGAVPANWPCFHKPSSTLPSG